MFSKLVVDSPSRALQNLALEFGDIQREFFMLGLRPTWVVISFFGSTSVRPVVNRYRGSCRAYFTTGKMHSILADPMSMLIGSDELHTRFLGRRDGKTHEPLGECGTDPLTDLFLKDFCDQTQSHGALWGIFRQARTKIVQQREDALRSTWCLKPAIRRDCSAIVLLLVFLTVEPREPVL